MVLQKIKTFYFIKFESILFVVCAFTLTFLLPNDILYCLYRVNTLTKLWPTLMHLENEYIISNELID
jgi:hypothetical protein